MGCDIHAVIEYDRFNDGYWGAFADGEFSIDRDYKLFSAIAFGDGGNTDKLPYPPRGLPADISDIVKRCYFEPVNDSNGIRGWDSKAMAFRKISKTEARKQLPAGIIKKLFLKENLVPRDMVHTGSWLHLSELKETLKCARLKVENLSASFRAVYSALEILSGEYSEKNVRLVFWFDS